MSDTELRLKGIEILIRELGKVNAEKFIALINTENFDYTEWQKKLYEGMTVEEISADAMRYQKTLDK